jgi:hypothetical protein
LVDPSQFACCGEGTGAEAPYPTLRDPFGLVAFCPAPPGTRARHIETQLDSWMMNKWNGPGHPKSSISPGVPVSGRTFSGTKVRKPRLVACSRGVLFASLVLHLCVCPRHSQGRLFGSSSWLCCSFRSVKMLQVLQISCYVAWVSQGHIDSRGFMTPMPWILPCHKTQVVHSWYSPKPLILY